MCFPYLCFHAWYEKEKKVYIRTHFISLLNFFSKHIRKGLQGFKNPKTGWVSQQQIQIRNTMQKIQPNNDLILYVLDKAKKMAIKNSYRSKRSTERGTNLERPFNLSGTPLQDNNNNLEAMEKSIEFPSGTNGVSNRASVSF